MCIQERRNARRKMNNAKQEEMQLRRGIVEAR
jgi:hypothetical protein